MAESESQIRARLRQLYDLKNAGVFSVRDGETSTQFRSLSELLLIIADLESQLPEVIARRRPRRPRYIVQRSKGL